MAINNQTLSRRQFIAFGLAAFSLGPTQIVIADKQTHLLSCRTDRANKHYLTMFNQQGIKLMDMNLPSRGHGITLDPDHKTAVVFARRPGNYIWVVDLITKQIIKKITAENGRHYYGHGSFTNDGRYMLSSENNFETGEGCIGVYDVKNNFKHIREFSSHGTGPHEIKMLNDGETLVIANGGIRTHPDLPRIKSNLHNMKPNLAYVDINNGQLKSKVEPPENWHQLSIRHIDVAADNTVAIAMQYQGEAHLHPPLIAIHKGHDALKLLNAPEKIQRKMHNYSGSISFSSDDSRFAVSSPRGNLVTYWSKQGSYLGMHKQSDACGISIDGNDFIISDGAGRLSRINASFEMTTKASTADTRWDNHLISI